MPVDGVLLGLHGAMVAFGYDDCEGDLIERVRAIVGPKAVIGVEQDPHCHLTEKRVRGADVMILFKEYPHIDFAERADELVTLVVKAIRGDIRPKMSLYDCGMIDLFPTTREPGTQLRRQDEEPGRPRRRAVGLARPRLSAGRRAGARHARAGGHRQRQSRRAMRSRASSARKCAPSAAPGARRR